MSVVSTTQVHIEGLLHLGALAIAITAAYVGLDRIKVENDDFSTGLARIKSEVAAYIGKHFDIRADRLVIVKRSLRLRAVIVLAHIGDVKVKVHWWTRPLHMILTNLRVPFYRYFLGRRDIRVMALCCLFSLLTFVYLVGLEVFDYDLVAGTQATISGFTFNLVRTLYCIYTAIIMLAFFSVSISSRLKITNLDRTCAKLYTEATKQRDKLATTLMEEAMEFRPKPTQSEQNGAAANGAQQPDQPPAAPSGHQADDEQREDEAKKADGAS
jgi:hypothetical protein